MKSQNAIDYHRHFRETVSVIYEVPQPYTEGLLVVYGKPDMGWYDFLAVDNAGRLLHDTDNGYGSAEIALRDALIWATR